MTRSSVHPATNSPCRECGAEFQPKRTDANFCSAPCRQKFHNRRRERGAILYDVMMINRNERAVAKKIRALHLATRLIMYWWKQDKEQRNGRKSWQDPQTVIDATQWARATIISR